MVPLSFAPFGFHGHEFALGACRALYWPRERALLVVDLHLEKGSHFARTGQMIPPYDSRETLDRIARAIRATDARRVLCLGDNFHDGGGPARLEPHAAGMLAALARVTDWVWITGNHDVKHGPNQDRGPDRMPDRMPDREHAAASLPGTTVAELEIAGLLLRHEAMAGEVRPELSGHWHPRLRVTVRGRAIARPCAVASERRLVLPAFGAFTGGLDAADPALIGALQPAAAIDALVPVADRIARFPLWRGAGAA